MFCPFPIDSEQFWVHSGTPQDQLFDVFWGYRKHGKYRKHVMYRKELVLSAGSPWLAPRTNQIALPIRVTLAVLSDLRKGPGLSQILVFGRGQLDKGFERRGVQRPGPSGSEKASIFKGKPLEQPAGPMRRSGSTEPPMLSNPPTLWV